VLGIPLFTSKVKATHNSPSLDKLDPKKGYVKGNIKIISQKANWLKSNSNSEELNKVLLYMKENGV
jgi:hypothetical protein